MVREVAGPEGCACNCIAADSMIARTLTEADLEKQKDRIFLKIKEMSGESNTHAAHLNLNSHSDLG